MSVSHRQFRGAVPRSTVALVWLMVDRELDALATVRSGDDGLRLRVLSRMADRACVPAAPAASTVKVAGRRVDNP